MAISMVLLSVALIPRESDAAQTIPYKINFQGKLTTSAGANVADGLYNMQFRIYDADTSGTQLWIETRQAGFRVQVTNGLFSVQLGDVSALSPTLFNSSSPRYFEITQATPATANCSLDNCATWESPMTPRQPMGAAAYAFNADTIDGIDGASLSQLGANNIYSGTNTFNNTVDVNSTSATAFTVRNGSTNLLSANASTTRVNIGAGETSDATAVTFVLDTKNTAGDPTGVNGAMYYNSNAGMFRCYEGGAWKNCITSAGGSATLQDAYNNSTAPATITTTATGKTLSLKAGVGFNSASLFDVSNASSVSLFSVNTLNDRVVIGNPTDDGVGVILKLDSKNTAGDPTGVDGAIYYNSALGQFRCYRDGDWEPCGTKPIDRAMVIDEEFLSGGTVAGTTTFYGNYNWAYSAMSAGGCNTFGYNGGSGGVAPSADRPGIFRITTLATAASYGCRISLGNAANMYLSPGMVIKTSAAVASTTATTNTLRIGADTSTNSTTAVTNSGVWWEADPSVSATNWRYCYANGSTAVCANGGALAANTFARLEIRINSTGSGTSSIDFIMNGTVYPVSGVTLNVANPVRPGVMCYTQAASAAICYADYYMIRSDASAAR